MRSSVQIILDGKIISEQKNLRAISDYGLRERVDSVLVAPIEPQNEKDVGAVLHVRWRNGATCTVTFGSFALCKNYGRRLAKRHSAVYTIGHKVGDSKPTGETP